MVNWKQALKGYGTLTLGATGGLVQTVAPIFAGSYEATVLNVGLTAIFVVLTAIGIKQINKDDLELLEDI